MGPGRLRPRDNDVIITSAPSESLASVRQGEYHTTGTAEGGDSNGNDNNNHG